MYHDYGDMTIYAETDGSKFMKNGKGKKGVLPLIVDIIVDIIKNGVTQKEVDLTKQYLQGSLNTSLDSNSSRCIHNGESLLFYPNEPLQPYNKLYELRYKNITLNEITAVARKYLTKTNMSVCVSGGNLPTLKDIKRLCEQIGE